MFVRNALIAASLLVSASAFADHHGMGACKVNGKVDATITEKNCTGAGKVWDKTAKADTTAKKGDKTPAAATTKSTDSKGEGEEGETK